MYRLHIPNEEPKPERRSLRETFLRGTSGHEPGPQVRVLQALKQGAQWLVRDGLELLKHGSRRFPELCAHLQQRGIALRDSLQTRPLAGMRQLVHDCCKWHLQVRMVRDDDQGRQPNAVYDEIQELLMPNGADGPPAEDGKLVAAILKLAQHQDATNRNVADLNATLGEFKAETGERFDRLESKTDRMGGQVNQLAGEVNQLGGQVNQLAGEVNQLGGQVNQLAGEVNQLTGESGNMKGERFENLSLNSLYRWLSEYTATRSDLSGYEPVLRWSDRRRQRNWYAAWTKLAEDLGIPVAESMVDRCDFLVSATWKSRPGFELLVVGEVSTDLNRNRQEKLRKQYRFLTEADNTVLPVMVGFPHEVLVDIPHLVDVQVPETQINDPEIRRPFEVPDGLTKQLAELV